MYYLNYTISLNYQQRLEEVCYYFYDKTGKSIYRENIVGNFIDEADIEQTGREIGKSMGYVPLDIRDYPPDFYKKMGARGGKKSIEKRFKNENDKKEWGKKTAEKRWAGHKRKEGKI